MAWNILVNADPVIEVWPKNRRTPCEITPEDNKTFALLTSHPFPVQVIEGLGMRQPSLDVQMLQGYIEGMGMGQAEITFIGIRVPLKNYDGWPPEGLDMGAAEITSVLLRQILKTYDNWPPEGFEMGLPEITVIRLEGKLVTYTNWPPEGFEMGKAEITQISLVTP